MWYHGTKQLYFGPVNFKFIRGGNYPLGKPCYKKRLGRTRVTLVHRASSRGVKELQNWWET